MLKVLHSDVDCLLLLCWHRQLLLIFPLVLFFSLVIVSSNQCWEDAYAQIQLLQMKHGNLIHLLLHVGIVAGDSV